MGCRNLAAKFWFRVPNVETPVITIKMSPMIAKSSITDKILSGNVCREVVPFLLFGFSNGDPHLMSSSGFISPTKEITLPVR
jgi:hypothetical protein